MKTTIISSLLIVLCFGASISCATQTNNVQENNKKIADSKNNESSDKFIKSFNTKPENLRKQYAELWEQMQQQIQTNNQLGTIDSCDKLEGLIPGNASIYNIKGTAYLKLKNIEGAKENFIKACELSQKNDTFLFNLGETFFVNHEYEKALKIFNNLLSRIEKSKAANLMAKSLLQFKAFISYTKLGKKDKAAEFVALYGINDDTPFYYCVRGINKWEEGQKQEALKDFASALNIYAPSGMYQPFGDTLVETGYMESIEGPTVPLSKKE